MKKTFNKKIFIGIFLATLSVLLIVFSFGIVFNPDMIVLVLTERYTTEDLLSEDTSFDVEADVLRLDFSTGGLDHIHIICTESNGPNGLFPVINVKMFFPDRETIFRHIAVNYNAERVLSRLHIIGTTIDQEIGTYGDDNIQFLGDTGSTITRAVVDLLSGSDTLVSDKNSRTRFTVTTADYTVGNAFNSDHISTGAGNDRITLSGNLSNGNNILPRGGYINTFGGNDTVRADFVCPEITVLAGAGNDTIRFRGSGWGHYLLSGDGNDTVSDDGTNIVIVGGPGRDNLSIVAPGFGVIYDDPPA